MNKKKFKRYKLIWAVALIINGICTIITATNNIFGGFLPDFMIRVLGIVLIIAASVIVFTSVKILIYKSENK